MFEFHVLWTKVETNICYSIPKEYTRNQKKIIKNICFLYNICNCFNGYENCRHRMNFNVMQKVIQNGPLDF